MKISIIPFLFALAIAPGCGQSQVEQPEASTSDALVSVALQTARIGGLNTAIASLSSQDANFRTAIATEATTGLLKGKIVATVGKQIVIAVPLSSVVKQSKWAVKLSAASGGLFSSTDLTSPVAPASSSLAFLPESAFAIIAIDYARYASIVEQYDTSAYAGEYTEEMLEMVNIQAMVDMMKTDLLIADDIALFAVATTAILGIAGLAMEAYQWTWDHSDSDGDGVLNKDDKYPYDKTKSFRYPPWAGGSFQSEVYVPLATTGQTAVDLTTTLYGKLVRPNSTSFDAAYASTVIAQASTVSAKMLDGTSVNVRFIK